ncbi:hypothetical protein GW17_00007095 [Ensete ventricosum]|nr:hypothetical protein GW17_00007095 [Ensete ventricosum]
MLDILFWFVFVLLDSYLFHLASEKGVPGFWLTAMKTNEVLTEEVMKSTIRDKIIPHAVSWFTGEAVEDDDEVEIEDEEDGEDEDEEDEEEDEDEDEDEEERGKSKKKQSSVGQKGGEPSFVLLYCSNRTSFFLLCLSMDLRVCMPLSAPCGGSSSRSRPRSSSSVLAAPPPPCFPPGDPAARTSSPSPLSPLARRQPVVSLAGLFGGGIPCSVLLCLPLYFIDSIHHL